MDVLDKMKHDSELRYKTAVMYMVVRVIHLAWIGWVTWRLLK